MFSWMEIFWPNSACRRRRNQVVREVERLKNALANNFSSINHLSEFLNSQIPNANLAYVFLDPSKSLSENARIFSTQANEVGVLIDKMDRKIKIQVEPNICEVIINPNTSFEGRIQAAREMSKASVNISSDTVIGVMGKLISKNCTKIIASKTTQFAATSMAVAIPTDCSEMSAGTLVETIRVATKKNNADDGIVELRVLVEGYCAESSEFTDTIHEVLADVTIWNKYHGL